MMVGQTARTMAEVVRKSIAHMAIDFRLAGIELAKLRQGRGALQAAGSERCVGERGALGRGGLSRSGRAGAGGSGWAGEREGVRRVPPQRASPAGPV